MTEKELATHYYTQQMISSHIHHSLRPAYPPKCLAASLHLSANQKTIEDLTEKVRILEAENRHLSETVNWMHDTIWNLLRKNVINS